MAKTTEKDNATVKVADVVGVVATNNIPEDATVVDGVNVDATVVTVKDDEGNTIDTINAPELVKVEVIKPFYDKTLIKGGKKKPEDIRKATTVFEATEERATELEAKGFVKRLK